MSSLPYTKIVDIADFTDPDLVPYLQEIAYDETIRFGLGEPLIVPDSKQWECAMMLRTFAEHGLTVPGAMFAGVGAGTEQTTFALAARGCLVFPTDRYLEVTPWSDVAPAGMMVQPSQYTNFKYSEGLVIPVHSDGRALRLPDSLFDGVYSAGSIEHFGSLDAVAAAAEEIGRVLKPGGVACVSTEFRLEGPNGRPWFDDSCILFTPELLDRYIIRPSGLGLVGSARFETSQGTYDARAVLLDFLDRVQCGVSSAEDKSNAYPNLVLYHCGFLFCSVHLALRKPGGAAPVRMGYASRFRAATEADARRASGALTGQIRAWTEAYASPIDAEPGALLAEGRAGRLEGRLRAGESEMRIRELEASLSALRNSRSFRITKPLRRCTDFVRKRPLLRRCASTVLAGLRRLKRKVRTRI